MRSISYFNLPAIFLLPSNQELLKAGGLLYAIGITTTFFYYSQYGILSADYLKPNAIIIGIYQWAYFVLAPRSLLLLVELSGFGTSKKLWQYLLFSLVLFLTNCCLFWVLDSLTSASCVWNVILIIILLILYTRFQSFQLNIAPSMLRMYLFAIPACLLFAYCWFPHIPNSLAGGKEVVVNVITTDSSLLKSRFAKHTYLLYETDDYYYFIERRRDVNTNILLQNIVKKVGKNQIKKIEFINSLWQPF